MASSKDIYEAKVFAANIWAAGVFRGTGVAAATYGFLQIQNGQARQSTMDGAAILNSTLSQPKALTATFDSPKVQNG